jgi:hypothetical protein
MNSDIYYIGIEGEVVSSEIRAGSGESGVEGALAWRDQKR